MLCRAVEGHIKAVITPRKAMQGHGRLQKSIEGKVPGGCPIGCPSGHWLQQGSPKTRTRHHSTAPPPVDPRVLGGTFAGCGDVMLASLLRLRVISCYAVGVMVMLRLRVISFSRVTFRVTFRARPRHRSAPAWARGRGLVRGACQGGLSPTVIACIRACAASKAASFKQGQG